MIVCPDCRLANDEESPVCSNCGRSLEPGPVFLGPARRAEGERPPFEIKAPKLPSRWRPVFVIGGAAAVVGAFVGWRFLKPDPCLGTNFTSDKFGYCLTVPAGWSARTAQVGSVPLDQFSLPTQPTTVLVEAVDLSSGTDLTQFAQMVRRQDDQAGLPPGPARSASLGGTDAEAWDITFSSQSGEAFQLREVVAVRNEVGWRITLNDSEKGFDTHLQSFQQMLDSWRFD